MKNLIPTPICFHEELDYVLYRPKIATKEEIERHTGDRFDLEGLTTPVFEADDHRDDPGSFDLSPPFDDLSIYGSFASGNPTYSTEVYFGVQDHGTHEYSISEYYAVKMRADLNNDQEDMRREAGLSLSHANITPILSAGETKDGRLYGVMEFVNGISVQQAVKLLTSYALDVSVKSLPARKRKDSMGLKVRPYVSSSIANTTPTHSSIRHIEKVLKRMLTRDQRTLLRNQFREELLKSMLKVGKALCYLEEMNLVHRDIKPSNILIVGDNDKLYPEIIDFGTCCEPLTMRGLANKRTEIMNHSHSPETVFGGKIDIRHDFFCLGRLMYFIATDKLPYQHGHEPIMEMQYLQKNPPASTGDHRLDEVILPMLAINPDERLCGKDFVSQFSRYIEDNSKF